MIRRRLQILLAAVALVVPATAAGGLRDLRATDAAWSDGVYATARASAREAVVKPALRCTVMVTATRQPRPDGECRVASLKVSHWGERPVWANIDVDYVSNANERNYLAVELDLSLAQGWTGPFNWAMAGTLGPSDGQYTLPKGFQCSRLPAFVADLPPNIGATPHTYIRLVDDRTREPASLNCVP